jgi:hypothetical protein
MSSLPGRHPQTKGKHAHAKTPFPKHGHAHSPFFFAWELTTLTCVAFVGIIFLFVPSLHLNEAQHREVEQWVIAAEIILIAEVTLLLFVARNKFHFIKRNWLTILAVIPLGGGFRIVQALKVGWHAFEKTKLGHFLTHPLNDIRRWMKEKLGLRV